MNTPNCTHFKSFSHRNNDISARCKQHWSRSTSCFSFFNTT